MFDLKKAFDIMSENEFIDWVWKLYNNMVQLSGIHRRSVSKKKTQNFDDTMLLNDSVA